MVISELNAPLNNTARDSEASSIFSDSSKFAMEAFESNDSIDFQPSTPEASVLQNGNNFSIANFSSENFPAISWSSEKQEKIGKMPSGKKTAK